MKKVVIVGAGIVGICCAVRLRSEGHDVLLIDRNPAGSQCSYGNAGTLGGNAHFPSRSMLLKIPGMLLHPREPLSIVWRDFPKLVPWFWRYLAKSRPMHTLRIAHAAAALNTRVYEDMCDLLRKTGLSDHLHWRGRLFAYRSTAALAAEAALMQLKFQAGVEMIELSGDQAREMEPALGAKVACAVFTPDAGHIVNPVRLSQELTSWFAAAGGKVLQEEVTGFVVGNGLEGVRTTHEIYYADDIVIAAGAWSASLAKALGTPVSLVSERGYHAMLTDPGVAIRIPTMWVDRKVAITPMEHGIRIAGISEFGMPDSPPDYHKIQMMLDAASEVIPDIRVETSEHWQGNRPATPDYLPVIGATRKFPNAHFVFGHGHSGLMFAPVTATLIADSIGGRRSAIDMAPYAADRFL